MWCCGGVSFIRRRRIRGVLPLVWVAAYLVVDVVELDVVLVLDVVGLEVDDVELHRSKSARVERMCIHKKEADLEEVVGVVEDEELSRRDVSVDDNDGGPHKMGNLPGR